MGAQPTVGGDQPVDHSDVQGNILAGFNKDHQMCLFVDFTDQPAARAWIGELARKVATSGEVLAFNDRFVRLREASGREGDVAATWLALALSYTGLERLGATELDRFPAEFSAGMRAAAPRLGDVGPNDPSTWTAPFDGSGELHALVIVAGDDPDEVARAVASVREASARHAVREVGALEGRVREDLPGHEHFGFKDGISQPQVAGLPARRKAAKGIAGEPVPLGEFVLQPGSGGDSFPSWAVNGSYLVFRRLRQDVGAFVSFLTDLAQQLGVDGETLQVKLLGRYKSGAPLEPTGAEPGDAAPADVEARLGDDSINDFDYEPQDPDGHLVPRSAHIRKTFARNQTEPGPREAQRRRIIRRGVPYGPPYSDGEPPYPPSGPPASTDRGLLFLCYQASLREQFEYLQRHWANSDGFPSDGDGRDPLISQDLATRSFTLPPLGQLALERWVQTTGGEYFFQPSVSALLQLGG